MCECQAGYLADAYMRVWIQKRTTMASKKNKNTRKSLHVFSHTHIRSARAAYMCGDLTWVDLRRTNHKQGNAWIACLSNVGSNWQPFKPQFCTSCYGRVTSMRKNTHSLAQNAYISSWLTNWFGNDPRSASWDPRLFWLQQWVIDRR
jgi:hypothetical protein